MMNSTSLKDDFPEDHFDFESLRALGYKNNNMEFSLRGRIKSVMCAVKGLSLMIASQHNAWIHLLLTIFVFAVGLRVGLARAEWCAIVLAIVSVWTAEALNTAFEFLADVASPDFHPLVEKAKDVAAGAVLITAIGAILIALLVFGPYVV